MKYFYVLRSIIHTYFFLKSKHKEKIQSDIYVYFKEYAITPPSGNIDYKKFTAKEFVLCINKCKEFRSNFYLRVSQELQKKTSQFNLSMDITTNLNFRIWNRPQ